MPHRFLCSLLLAAWAAPGASALAVGAHVALEHHGDPRHDGTSLESHAPLHARDLADLIRAVAHGHHHDADAAEHGHDARLGVSAAHNGPVALSAVVRARGSEPVASRAHPPSPSASRRAPPGPLFATHSSLLL